MNPAGATTGRASDVVRRAALGPLSTRHSNADTAPAPKLAYGHRAGSSTATMAHTIGVNPQPHDTRGLSELARARPPRPIFAYPPRCGPDSHPKQQLLDLRLSLGQPAPDATTDRSSPVVRPSPITPSLHLGSDPPTRYSFRVSF